MTSTTATTTVVMAAPKRGPRESMVMVKLPVQVGWLGLAARGLS